MCIILGNIEKPIRSDKGKSLLNFVANYTLVDLETTGLSPMYDSILEVSAIKVRENKIIDTYSSLVNPSSPGSIYIDDFITELTGITSEMIKEAPYIKEIFPQFLDFIGSDIVIGHNVNFDINFIYDESVRLFGKAFSNDFIDTMRLSRRIHPEIKHHRLSDLSERYSIDSAGAHRGLKDCEITKSCYDMLNNEVIQNWGNVDMFIKCINRKKQTPHSRDISATVDSFDKFHSLYGKICAFTGTLEKMPRKEAMQVVANLGGINADSVTKKTNFLILGCNDYCKSIKGGKSNKQKKAEKLRLEGQDISVISEDVFYEMAGID